MRVAVTGAAGFVGLNVLNELVGKGHEVRAIDRVTPEVGAPEGIEWQVRDILDPAAMREALDGIDTVLHLVALITLAEEDPIAWKVNVEGARTVAEAAHACGVRRLVHCSSMHAFNQRTAPDGRLDEASPRSDDPTLPVYDRSKWAGEQAVQEVISAGLDGVICNPTGVYGPVDYGQLSRFNLLLRSAARGRVPIMVDASFDFVDVRDVATGLVSAAEKGRTGENYLLPGHYVSMLDVFRMAADASGHMGPLFGFSVSRARQLASIVKPVTSMFKSDIFDDAAFAALDGAPTVDGAKARAELGYEPRPAEDTVRDLVAFFVETGQLRRGSG